MWQLRFLSVIVCESPHHFWQRHWGCLCLRPKKIEALVVRLGLVFVSRQWEPWGADLDWSLLWEALCGALMRQNQAKVNYASSVVKVHSRSLLLGGIALAVHLVSLPNPRWKPYQARIVIMGLLSSVTIWCSLGEIEWLKTIWNYTQYFVITCKGRKFEEVCMCVYTYAWTELLCCIPETNMKLYINYISILKTSLKNWKNLNK